MSNFRDYKFSLKEVSAICADEANGEFLWIAFKKNSSGVCVLRKVSAHDLTQTYFTLNVSVDAINALQIFNGIIFLAVDHSTISLFAYSISNPLTNSYTVNRPAGITENAIKIGVGAANVYYLTPGLLSATTAKLISFSASPIPTFVETVTLQQSAINVTNAKAITVDGSENVWVGTNTSPVNLIRAWKVTGVWHLSESIFS